eukprot:GHVN01041938.1.p1 GENE.GHVN01041938.1~~GHVN01041938.1.p1  ORF type:complete len:507 (+),score=61.08 GHVN01041938.1:163-1683(+)
MGPNANSPTSVCLATGEPALFDFFPSTDRLICENSNSSLADAKSIRTTCSDVSDSVSSEPWVPLDVPTSHSEQTPLTLLQNRFVRNRKSSRQMSSNACDAESTDEGNNRRDQPLILSAANESADPPVKEYVYSPPLTSPFYRHVISPLCDWLCHTLVPRCITPDQISYLALAAAIAGCVISFLSGYQLVVAALWVVYGLLDNIDGKQARRLKMSTAGGEFLDHSADSIVTSLSALIWINALVPHLVFSEEIQAGWQSWVWGPSPAKCCVGILPVVASICGQFPFFLSSVATHIIGRVLLGAATLNSSQDLFTVDEYNIIFLPILCIIRHAAPWLWDTVIVEAHQLSHLTHVSHALKGSVTVGVAAAALMFVICFIGVVILSVQLLCAARKKDLPLFIPGLAYITIVWTLRPSYLLCICPFACLCMELLLGKIRVVTRWIRMRVWWPIVWTLIVSLRWLNPTLSCNVYLGLHWVVCGVVLLWYKFKVNRSSRLLNEKKSEKTVEEED